jgi:prepilin-type N-terminal cleavage/methylation domain-containing protein
VTRTRPDGEAGLTLIELMVSIVIAGIVLAMVLGTHARLSSAFRAQAKVAQLSTTLRAARGRIAAEIRQAGYLIPDGFLTARFGALHMATNPLPPIGVDNDADGFGPDRITIYYADVSSFTRVLSFAADRSSATVEDSSGFQGGDLVLFVNPRVTGGSSTTSGIGHYDACLVKLTTVVGGGTPGLYFAGTLAPFNAANNPQCQTVATATADEGTGSQTVAVKLAIRSYRLDPAQQSLGVLQVSTNALDPTPTWSDLAVGVVNMQFATRYYEEGDADDLDDDGLPERDWYSGDAQEIYDPGGERPDNGIALEVSLSLEVRTIAEVTGAPSLRSNSFTDESDPPSSYEHSTLGDWPALNLVGADPDRPAAYEGRHLFRSSTLSIDLRNIGVGR